MRHSLSKLLNAPIIQCSPPRTGSTLIWNILRIGYPEHEVIKTHGLTTMQRALFPRYKIVATIRNPLDAIASSIQRYGKKPTQEVIVQQISEFENNGIPDIVMFKDKTNVLVLKYEMFVNDFDFIFKAVESFFGRVIDDERKHNIKRDYSLAAVEKRSAELGDFQNCDAADQIHGKHVSPYRGASDYYKELLNEEQIDLICHRFSKVFDAFGYSRALS